MDIEYSNIIKYNRLKNNLKDILSYMDNEDYTNAYYKAVALLEFVNSVLLMKQFKIKLQDTGITNIIEHYSKLDKELFSKMLGINSEYNRIDDNSISKSDVEYLLMDIDYIVGYIVNKYGYNILA